MDFIKKLIVLAICIVLLLALIGGILFTVTNIRRFKTIAYFNSIEEMRVAIKNDPHKYNERRVSVKGYFYINQSGDEYLLDNLPVDDSLWEDEVHIPFYYHDKTPFAVLENGDYINLEGVVCIRDSLNLSMSFSTATLPVAGQSQTDDNIIDVILKIWYNIIIY